MKPFSCEDAKQIDMVEYLAGLGYHPAKPPRGNDYWYLSPLPGRNEKDASFKINRKKNVWYDHGIGKGGDIIDFGTLFHNCTIQELLKKLSDFKGHPVLSFGSLTFSDSVPGAKTRFAGEKKETTDNKIIVLDARQLAAKELLDYLQKRFIPLEIAHQYCREVDFLLYGKQHTVIGFQNNSGGYELRNENFKGSSSPKDITFIDHGKSQVAVFEGNFDFLSFQTINHIDIDPLTNFLILNSLSFFEKCRELMEKHDHIHLFLNRDTAGFNCTKQAIEWNNEKFIDRSGFYRGRKDLNEWLIHHHYSLKQCQRISRGL
jgi:hypothetical protein